MNMLSGSHKIVSRYCSSSLTSPILTYSQRSTRFYANAFYSTSALSQLNSSENDVYIISTASRGIGLEFVRQLLERTSGVIVGFYRGSNPSNALTELQIKYGKRLILFGEIDLANLGDMKAIISSINSIGHVKLLINSAGILGDGKTTPGPERSVTALDKAWLQKTLNVNLVGHVLVTKEIIQLITSQKLSTPENPSKIVNVSARVGSINDNRLGGWYSYRMSKAALNMFTKTLSVEAKRLNTAVISIHPGTVDTDISKPFQKNVQPHKLFPVDKSVDMMLNVIWNTQLNDTGKFFAYDGSEIPY